MKKLAIAHLCVCALLFLSLFSANSYGLDLLEQTFQQAKQFDAVINLGNTKQAVGNQVLNAGVSLNTTTGIGTTDPLIIRITKFLLRMTVVLGVTMAIYAGIQFMMASKDPGQEKKQYTFLAYIIGGILLALASVAIIQLLQSITFSSIALQ